MKICLEATAGKISLNVTLPAFVTAAFDAVARTARAIEEDTRPALAPTSFYERHPLESPGTAVTRDDVRQVVLAEAGHVLTDLEWRLSQARDLVADAHQLAATVDARLGDGVILPSSANVVPIRRQITAEDINSTSHQLTGYTVTSNTPIAGSIQWVALQIIYKGVQYNVTVDGTAAGSTTGNTALRFAYFVKASFVTVVTAASTDAVTGVVTPAVFSGMLTASATKPSLTADDLLVFVNTTGTVYVAGADSAASLPGVIADAAVDNGALQTDAVTGIKILANSIGSGKLGTGAINLATQFNAGVVTATVLGRSAVTAASLNTTAHTLN